MDKESRLASLWDEWLTSPVKSRSSADLETSGLLLGMKHDSITFSTNRLRAARRLTGPGKVPLWSLTSYAQRFPLAISMITRPNLKPSVRFTCPIEILRLPKNPRSAWPWLKGLFGSTGGLYFPKTGYYLTLIVSDPDTSEITGDMLNLTGLSWRKHRHEFTIRNYEDIMTFLCSIGLPSAALDLDSTALFRSVRNRANLESNYDSANIARTLKAAHEQTELARKIIAMGMLEKLPANLRELVTLRLEYPDESLGGLGKRLAPEISKSTVKYRWCKLQALFDEISNQHDS
ncbi:MAG: DNA-binding protein WhiA [Synergistaceae bacterium]|nr:DNA-binding protein WhiA [Synergistaceae bacterium]